MVFICWISQIAADYNHGSSHDEKKTTTSWPNKKLTRTKLILKMS
jgi:hypothetical protein